MQGEAASRERCILGVDQARPGALWESRWLAFPARHLLTAGVRVTTAARPLRHPCNTAGLVGIQITPAGYSALHAGS